jgi:hypothetical protein
MQIPGDLQQIVIPLHHDRVISALVEMAWPPMTLIEGHRIASIQVMHELREVRTRRVNDEVEMVRHQDVAQKLNVMELQRPLQEFEKRIAVEIVSEDGTPLISAGGDVVIRAGKLYA